jgi:hypothetical protein
MLAERIARGLHGYEIFIRSHQTQFYNYRFGDLSRLRDVRQRER